MRLRVFEIQASVLVFAGAARALAGCSDGSAGTGRFERAGGRDDLAARAREGELGTTRQALAFDARLATCADDPRVIAGLVPLTVCAGGSVFFEETFDGNGRTCGSCHPANNNTTLDVEFVTALRAARPDDPLFVFEREPALANLETPELLRATGILENVDGFAEPTRRFVSRTVSHVLALRTSLRPDPGDGTEDPPAESTGWAGDGSPDGTLRGFLQGAIEQHFPRTLERRPGVDFRLPSAAEAEAVEAFQLSLGRQNELDLRSVRLFDPEAEEGRQAFLDPARGRCNVCHANAGANFEETGKNRNFDTGTRNSGSLSGGEFIDVGFGGRDLADPNFDSDGDGVADAFGDGTFNTPPLIEAADTPPFFHNAIEINSKGIVDIDNAVTFYANTAFTSSVAARQLEERFGAPLELSAQDSARIARMLRVLNAALNVETAAQRLDAAAALVARFADTRADVQRSLLELARVELDDALDVLDATSPSPIYPGAVVALEAASAALEAGLASPSAADREGQIELARAGLSGVRGELGTNLTFELGAGNLMY